MNYECNISITRSCFTMQLIDIYLPMKTVYGLWIPLMRTCVCVIKKVSKSLKYNVYFNALSIIPYIRPIIATKMCYRL